jgi:branched-chain amino acid transport system substrate-binding protein
MRTAKRVLGFFCIAIALLTHAAHGVPAVSRDTVRVHHVSVITTGVLADPNNEALAGARLYLAKINANGGINGRKVEILSVDDKQDPQLTAQIAKDLVGKKEVLAFFMPRTSPSTLELLKVSEPAGIPLVAAQAGSDFLYDPAQRSAFTIRASQTTEVLRAIELQHRLGRRSFAFIAADDATGNALVVAATTKLSGLSLKPLVEKIDNRNPDVAKAVAAFATSKPEVVFLLCASKCAIDFIVGYKRVGGTSQIVATSNNSSNTFIKRLGKDAHGLVIMQILPPPTSKVVKVSKEYAAAAAAAKIEPSYTSMFGYVAGKVLGEAIRRAGSKLTAATLVDALESMRSYDLGDFTIGFDPNNRVGTNFVDETMITKEGKFLR